MNRLAAASTIVFLVGIAGVPDLSGQSHPGDRGSFLIGGEASLNSSTITWVGMDGEEHSDERTRLFVAPSLQYFLVPGLAFGGQLSMGWYSGGEWYLAGGPALTYFFFRGERPWNLYLSGNLEIGKTWNPEIEEDPTHTSYRGAGGALLMVSSGVGIHTEAFYEFQKWDYSSRDIKSNEYGLAAGISVFVF